MFGLWASKRILLFTGETDLRKGYDGLAALVTAAGGNDLRHARVSDLDERGANFAQVFELPG